MSTTLSNARHLLRAFIVQICRRKETIYQTNVKTDDETSQRNIP